MKKYIIEIPFGCEQNSYTNGSLWITDLFSPEDRSLRVWETLGEAKKEADIWKFARVYEMTNGGDNILVYEKK